jgi:hypothetical protein
MVECTEQSITPSDQPIVLWRWEFGDGATSSIQSPRHTYAGTGEYEITLIVTTLCGGVYTNRTTDHVYIYCSAPEPAFTTDVVEGTAPLTVQVTDLTQDTPKNITTWTYWFDNSHTSYQRNPVFTYIDPGTYTIRQTVRKTCMDPGVSVLPVATRQIIVLPEVIYETVAANQTTAAKVPSPKSTITSAAPAAKTAVVSPVPVTTAAADKGQGVPEAPRTGTLSVITEPAGAQVYVDNVLRGTSPAAILDLLTGPHTLRLEKEGYRNTTVMVAITEGNITGYSATLVQEPGGIAIVPVIALVVIILGVAGGGIYMYRRREKE